MRLTVTLMGCGTSTGVPRLPDDWGACDPTNPKNRRTRPALLVQSDTTTLAVDTGPDFRQQMLAAGATRLDAVLYTHDHADHTHGIDDLRGFFFQRRAPVPLYGAAETLATIQQRFDYIFVSRQGYPVIGRAVKIAPQPFRIGDIDVRPFVQGHGAITSLGFRFGDLAYSTDVNALDAAALEALAGVRIWIVDAVRYHPHPSHAHLDQALDWIAQVRPARAILTHMAPDMDYDTLCRTLPEGVEPGFDGMVFQVAA
ncbi:MAG: MBL fold metallo-hydrolase [Rhodothalassiaceae bacterium]